jgi:hypothetical protein
MPEKYGILIRMVRNEIDELIFKSDITLDL